MDTQLSIIGTVESPLKDLKQCPKQYTEGAPEAFVVVAPAFADGVASLEPGHDVLVFTWLHKADRSTLSCHPRGNKDLPRKGIFNTRSPDRPNPIGLHLARILDIHREEEGVRIHLSRLEVLDGTPVVDIKPAADLSPGSRHWGSGIPAQVGEEIRDICHAGWQQGLFSGFNGNVSVRLGDSMVITRSGAAKGFLGPNDLTTVNLETGRTTGPGTASSEAGMHLEIYRNAPQARAIVHTHPPRLLALTIKFGKPDLELPLYESAFYRAKLGEAPALEPGTQALAQAVGKAAVDKPAIFMGNHGLAVHGPTLTAALALSEELDSLAGIRLDAN